MKQKLTTAGSYEVPLVVTDDEGDFSNPYADSVPHTTITVVGVTFDPNSVTVSPGGNVTVQAQVTPATRTAVAAVQLSSNDETVATVLPTSLTEAYQTVTITGVAGGPPTKIIAKVDVNGVYQAAGSADIKVVGEATLTIDAPDKIVVDQNVTVTAKHSQVGVVVTLSVTGGKPDPSNSGDTIHNY